VFRKREWLYLFSMLFGIMIMFYIIFPILNTMSLSKPEAIREALTDQDVIKAIILSMVTGAAATLVSLICGVPFAYLLARKNFPGKSLVESIVDIPVVIPHTVAGICILTMVSPRCWFGRLLETLHIEVVGTEIGIVAAMVFVSIPLLINSSRNAFNAVSPRLENVSRTLGASHFYTFFHISCGLSWRGILSGAILTWARAISEFGAVIILAYHPMIAPTMIYERYTAYGLTYAVPVAGLMVFLSLLVFLLLRIISVKRGKEDD
jgi:molybdate/tungstate transport system permease protein